MSSPADVSTLVDIFTIGQLAFNQLDPPFTMQVAQAMEEAYQISPDFSGTPYEYDPKRIQAFHLCKELTYLANRR
ncbi:MAG: hypothetical protein IPL78_24575 [Chloroflexi bacterium]|nr:hypothetical protein [Chloroflexota bacterium]